MTSSEGVAVIKREAQFSRERGRGIVKVPLGGLGVGRHATLYQEDYDFLRRYGVLFHNWFINAPQVVSFRTKGGHIVSVARILMECEGGHRVRYLDGDGTNLRRDNLRVVSGKGKHSDIDRLISSMKRSA